MIAACLANICSLLEGVHSIADWHSQLMDPETAVVLREQDRNIASLQSKLQSFSGTDNKTFGSVITFLMTQICVVQDEYMLFTYIRAVLEVFVLYSISTSDFAWIDEDDAAIGRQIELMFELTFSNNFKIPQRSGFISMRDCLLLATLIQRMSHREHCRSEIIKRIVQASLKMPHLHQQFETFKHDSCAHQCNSTAFVRRIKLSGHYWIAMAYCLAIEPSTHRSPPKSLKDHDFESPPTYNDLDPLEPPPTYNDSVPLEPPSI